MLGAMTDAGAIENLYIGFIYSFEVWNYDIDINDVKARADTVCTGDCEICPTENGSICIND